MPDIPLPDNQGYLLRSVNREDIAFALLFEHFPKIDGLDWPDDRGFGPHYAYERLASEILAKHKDDKLFKAACTFINELANSRDPLLQNILNVSLLESVAQDPSLANKLKASISDNARAILEKIEKEFYGRS